MLAACFLSNAATISSTAVGGAWNATSTWAGGIVPLASDDVIIVSGATVSLTTSQSCKNLTINGSGILNLNTNTRTLTITANLTLNGTSAIQGNAISRIVSVGGDFVVPALQSATVQNITLSINGSTTIDGTLIFNTGNSATKTFTGTFTIGNAGTFVNTTNNVPITLGGNMVNNGTFSEGTGRVTFTGVGSNTITGSAASTGFGGGITVNKGASQANVLDVQVVITMSNGGLTLTNGTFKLSSASTITPFTSDPAFGATAQLWCNGGTMLGGNTFVTFQGAIQVTAGTLNVGTAADDFLTADGGSLTISGGALNIAGELSDSALGPPSAGLIFNMSGGVLTVATATGNTIDYPFSVDTFFGSQFMMTGGTLVIQNFSSVSGYSSNAGFYNHVTGSAFTGGTLQIGNASTASGSLIEIDTTEPIYNLAVSSSAVTASIVNQAITVTNDVTVSFGILNPNALGISLGGNWTNNDTFTSGTSTITFNGAALQTIAGSSTTSFYGLSFNNTSGLIPGIKLNVTTTATNTLTMASGIIDLGGTTFSLGQPATASTLNRTASTTTNWMYAGTFKRFWLNATAVTSTSGNFYGLFPMGASTASSYRPFEINSTANPTAAGSYSLTHTNYTGVTDLSPVYNDAGTNVVRIDNSQFVGSISGVTGGTYNLSATMTGLVSTGNLSDIRLAIFTGGTTSSSVGVYAVATGTVSNPTAKRTGASVGDLTNDFRVATTNSSITPLPITFVEFFATLIPSGVELKWTTASEIRNDFFTVLHSTTGENFKNIGTTKGGGTTDAIRHYSFTDYDPAVGQNYYKLEQTDFDGRSTTSHVIATLVTKVQSLIETYPNPVSSSGELIVEVHGDVPSVTKQITIRDLHGSCVASFSGMTDAEGVLKIVYHPSEIPSGLYIIEIGSGIYRKVMIRG